MRIGINLLYLLPGVVGGTETYAAGLLQGLAAIVSDNEFVVFVNREAADWPLPPKSNFTRIVCPITGSSRAQRYYFEQIRLPLLLRRERIDLVHSLGYVGPVIGPCPSVLTIPDSNFVDVAQTIPPHRRIALSFVSRQAARTANEIITISEFLKGATLSDLEASCRQNHSHPFGAAPGSDLVVNRKLVGVEAKVRYSRTLHCGFWRWGSA